MLAKKYKSEIVSINNLFEDIYTLEFKSLGRKFKFQPGQFLHLAIDDEYDGIGQWPESRCFSMQSNPHDETLKITYAVKGNFTKEMKQYLKVGAKVWLKLPYGDLFSQPHSLKNTIFIAGGTGITPFLSLFTHPSFNEYENPRIYLGFRSPKYNIYESELSQIINNNAIVYKRYQDKSGVLDIKQIVEENGIENSYFISGPPEMIKLFKQSLINKGVNPNNVLTDDWE